jgi:hypothetical protein
MLRYLVDRQSGREILIRETEKVDRFGLGRRFSERYEVSQKLDRGIEKSELNTHVTDYK